jgi:hypothetical protein
LIIALSVLSIGLLPTQGPSSTGPSGLASLAPASHRSNQGWSILAKGLASLGISAGLIWGVVQFWYSNQYVPSTFGAALVISPTLTDVGQLQGLRRLTAEVTIKNTSSTRIRAITSLYKVEGLQGIKRVRNEAEFFSGFDPVQGNRTASRFGQERTVEVLQFGKLLEDNWYFEPGEELKTQFLIHAPHDKYVSLRLTADIVMAKGSRLVPEDEPGDRFTLRITPDAVHPYDLQFSILEWPLKQISNIRGLTKGRHAVDIVIYHVGRNQDSTVSDSTVSLPGLPTMSACIDQINRDLRAISKADPKAVCQHKKTYRRELQDFYGMVRTSTVYEVPLQ